MLQDGGNDESYNDAPPTVKAKMLSRQDGSEEERAHDNLSDQGRNVFRCEPTDPDRRVGLFSVEEDSKREEDDQGRHGKRDAANVTNYLRVRHGGRLLSALAEGCGLCCELRALT